MVNQADLPDCQLLFATVDRVKNGSGGESTVLLLCPDERTSRDAVTESVVCHKQTHASAANFDAGTGAVHYIELRPCTAASISRAEPGRRRSMIMLVRMMQVCE